MRRLFDDAGFIPAPSPAADVYETPQEFVVELEVPGFADKDLALEITDHTLIVKGQVKEEKERDDRTFLLHERLERTFERRFFLPDAADTDKLTATFRGLMIL